MIHITLEQHLSRSADRIAAEAREYAKNYNVNYERALRDVTDEYTQAWHEAMREDLSNYL